mmetsp:Transcript_16310/g.23285  ORF Transcript_16310/g.23285 Transcript_16310/m.23285 type:complete len:152 (-) Transcript_16310:54-509(-)
MTTIGHLLKIHNTSEVKAKIRVKIRKAEFPNDTSGRKYMVWLKRKGKSRGTALVNGKGLEVTFDEDVTLSVTLYKDHRTGLYQRKRFALTLFSQQQVLDSNISAPTMAKEIGYCEIDVSHSSELNCVRLRPKVTGGYVDAKIWFSVTVDDH